MLFAFIILHIALGLVTYQAVQADKAVKEQQRLEQQYIDEVGEEN